MRVEIPWQTLSDGGQFPEDPIASAFQIQQQLLEKALHQIRRSRRNAAEAVASAASQTMSMTLNDDSPRAAPLTKSSSTRRNSPIVSCNSPLTRLRSRSTTSAGT